jgi:hypothetical protein
VWVIEKFSRGAWRPTGNAFITKASAEVVCSLKRDDVVKYRLKLYYGITDPYKEKKWLEIQQKAQNLHHAVAELLDFDFSKQGSWDPYFVRSRDRFKNAEFSSKSQKIKAKSGKNEKKKENTHKSRARGANGVLGRKAVNWRNGYE